MSIEANMCSCCKEIWNQNNLNSVSLGKYNLYLCPECFKEYKDVLKKTYIDGQNHPTKRFDQFHG